MWAASSACCPAQQVVVYLIIIIIRSSSVWLNCGLCVDVQVMSRELFDYLVREKIADGALIAKWRKPGFEILCSMLAVQKGNHNFGTTSHCRVSCSLSTCAPTCTEALGQQQRSNVAEQ